MGQSQRVNWSPDEVVATVESYFGMLELELLGREYSKAESRRALVPRLNGRSEGSIEFKHQNVSAVLVHMEIPYITGYKPRNNFQNSLWHAVDAYLQRNAGFFNTLIDSPVLSPRPEIPQWECLDYTEHLVSAPEPLDEPPLARKWHRRRETRVDFARRDAEDHRLDQWGQQWALAFEKSRLSDCSAPYLVDRVEHVSQREGAGIGYDIRTFSTDETECLIKVKTTALGQYSPFQVTRNELECSINGPARYMLYRVFDFGMSPKVFVLEESLAGSCRLDPIAYRARSL